ncbi:MAG TPA: hypothetical protein VKJ00_05795 [Thermoanaerobaculia bacterium]|nr:hypothetical protein [Thermoanaerobaculia bacterium]
MFHIGFSPFTREPASVGESGQRYQDEPAGMIGTLVQAGGFGVLAFQYQFAEET